MDFDVSSCPQHIEVKLLANKLWNRWFNLCDKLTEEVLSNNNNSNKIISIANKAEGVNLEFNKVLKGLCKCCYKK